MEHYDDDEVVDAEVVDDPFGDANNPPTIPLGPGKGRSLQNLERQKRALALRRAGATFQVIADECGYSSASNAARAVKRALGNEIREASDEYLALQLMRSEQLLMVVWGEAMNGDHGAWDRALTAVKHIDGYVGTKAGSGSGGLTINLNGGTEGKDQNVLVIQGDTDSYKQGLMAMAQDHGFDFPELGEGEDDPSEDDA